MDRMMSDKVIYLAGPINGRSDSECNDWRSEAKRIFGSLGFSFKDPMSRDYRGREDSCAAEIVEGDKDDISGCSTLLVRYDKPSVGTSMEILYAYDRGINVVVVADDITRISPWMRYHANAIVSTLERAVSFVH